MRYITKLMIFFMLILSISLLSACSEQVSNEHLPEYCQTYTGFMSVASDDFYDLLGDINRFNYLSVISQIELEFEANDPANTIDLDGLQCFQNLTSLTLSGQSFKDISQISALINIQKITLINTSVVSIDSFKNLSKVNELTISESRSLQSVDGVEEMTKLTYLDLSDNGIVNIEGLNNLVNLESLSLRNNDITYFPSINMLKKLKSLDISNNNVSELGSDLSGLSNLETLNASNNNICDLSSLDDLSSLEVLDLSFNNLSCNGGSPDFTGLTFARNLEELYLNDNELVSVSDLSDKPLPLRVLHLENNFISDITPIKNFSFLEELYLDHNNISSIGDLTGLTNISGINLSFNQVSDMTDLLELSNLEYIILTSNNLTELPDLEEELPSLRYLDVSFNQLSDISGLEGHPRLEEINISDNGLSTLSGLSNMPYLDNVTFDEDATLDEDELLVDNNNIFTHIDRSFNGLDRYNWLENGVLNAQTFITIGMVLGDSIRITDSFNGIETLEAIVLDGFGLQEINASSFQGSLIETVIINDNALTSVDFLQSIATLNAIDASNNELTDVGFLNNTEGVFDNLEFINLSGNTLTDLSNTFNNLPNLKILEIQDNPVTTLNNTFNYLPNLGDFTYTFGNVETIVNSLNHSFVVAYNDNAEINIILGTESLTLIEESFNESRFDDILVVNPIQNDLPSLSILNSFNVETQSVYAVNITIGNNIETIENSFTNIALSNISVDSVETMNVNNSFNDLIILTMEIEASEYQEGHVINTSFNNLSFFDIQTISMDIINIIISPESIVNSFNNINSSSLFLYSNQGLTTIENSFSDSKYGVLSVSLDDGVDIENSFNTLDVERIAITTDSSTTSGSINTSFNDVSNYNATQDVEDPVISMALHQNISSLTNSFNRSIFTVLDLSSNQLSEIDETNFDSTAVFNLNVSDNQFTSFDTSLFPSLLLLSLANNQLTSVSEIKSLADLEVLDLSNQIDDNENPTLLVLDGINDVPNLSTLIIDGLYLEGVDGLRNTGLSEFILNDGSVNQNALLTISEDSFTNTPLESLDIQSINLTSSAFLSQLTELNSLKIKLDIDDFTVFSGLPFVNILTTLELEVPFTIDSFSELSNFSALESLTLSAPDLTELYDLELGTLTSLELPYEQITAVYNSFNLQGEIDIQDNIITPLVNVALISTSFDGYLGSYDVISDLTYIDSFNNVTTVNVTNSGESAPTFDTDSFDSVRTMKFTSPEYDSFDFINEYESLTLLLIDTLDYESITNSTKLIEFNLLFVESFTVDEILIGAGSTLDLTVNLNTPNASFITLASSTSESLELSSIASYVSVDMAAGNLTINSYINPSVNSHLNGTYTANTFVVDYDVESIVIGGSAEQMIVNSDILQKIQTEFSMVVLDTLVINQPQTLSSAFELYSVQATNIVLNTPQIDSFIVNSSLANLTINSNIDGLIATVDVTNIVLNNTMIQSANVYGTVTDSISFNTPLLESINGLNQTTLQVGSEFVVTTDTNQPLSIENVESNGSLLSLVLNTENVSTYNLDLDVYDSEINSNGMNLTINYLVSGQITLNDANLQELTLDTIHFDTLYLSNNIPLSNLIERNTLDKTINTQFSQSISLSTTENILEINVLNTEIELEGNALSQLDVTSENQVSINNSDVNLTITANVESLILSLPNLETLIFNNGSQMGELTLLASSITQLDLGDITLDQVNVTTTANMMTYQSTDISEVIISGDNLVGIDLDAGIGNNITFTSSASGNLTAEVVANAFALFTRYTLISISNDSQLSQLTISNDDLTNVITGFADVGQIDITYQTTDISIYSENASNITLNSSANNETVDVNAPFASELNISSTSSDNLIISTNTEQVNVSSPGDVLLVSNTINTINMNTENVFSLDVTTPDVGLVIIGSAQTLIVDGANIQSLDVSSVSADELLLYNTSVSILDFSATSSGIKNFNIITNLTEFTIINPSVIITSTFETVKINGENLSTVNITSAVPIVSVLEIETGANSFTLNGDANNLELIAPSATSITMTNSLIISSATFTTPNVASYNLVTMPTESTLNITTTENEIDVAFNGNLLNLVADSGASLIVSKQAESDIEINTNVDSIELNMSLLVLSNITINDNDLTQLSGKAPNIILNQTSDSILLVASVTADLLEINSSGPTTLMMVGSDRTIQTLRVESDSIRTITTGDVIIKTLAYLYSGSNDLSVDSYAETLNVTSTQTIDELDLTLRAISPDVTTVNANYVKLTATNEYDLTLDTNAQDIVVQLANSISLNWTYGDTDLSLDVATKSLDLILDLAVENSLLNSVVETFEIKGRIDGPLSISYLEETNNYSYDFSTLEGVTEFTLINDKLSSTDTIAPFIDTLTTVSFNAFDIDEFGYISDFIDMFENTNITVWSNISATDLYNQYYNRSYSALVIEEAFNKTIYDSYYDDLFNQSLSLLTNSEFFDGYTVLEKETFITNQVYPSASDVFENYSLSLGYITALEHEETIGTDAYNQMIADIQLVLDDEQLIILSSDIDTLVEAMIISLSEDDARDALDNKGFILIEQGGGA
jgi:Leucine-rich repeat (LRR) protein